MQDAPLPLLTPDNFLLTILVKVAVMAVLATMLARYHRFRHILIFERRGWVDRLVFTLALAVPLAAGVAFRVQLRYYAADLTLEGALLAGLIAGPYTGALVGFLVSLPAVLLTAVTTGSVLTGEFIALPFAVGCGFAGGGLREACPTKETIWQFTPFVFLDLPKHLFKMLRNREPLWQIILLLAPVALELLRQFLGLRFNHAGITPNDPDITRLFYLEPPRPWMMVLVVLATVLCVATPIKIWNSARIEHRVQEQEKLLLAAKIESLKSQINPHFLFNTLTSISSLIRAEPDTARTLIIRLSALLRRLLRSHQHFVTLREELEAIDEYLDIEVIRFGPKLKVVKDIDPDTIDLIVPSMILQPLVENSIKHGFSRKVGPGSITIRSHREHGRAVIEVEDDGMGFFAESLDQQSMSSGIGLANVRERLRVIYGATYQLKLSSEPGKGTLARIEVPELATVHPISA